MSVRRRTWITRSGQKKSAWVVSYSDTQGTRRLKTFARKGLADDYHRIVVGQVKAGVHVVPSESITVSEASKLWLDSIEGRIEKSTGRRYEEHCRLHINLFLGRTKLAALATPTIRQFETDLLKGGRSLATTRHVIVTLGTLLADCQERGLIAMNPVRGLRAHRRGKERRAERRQRGRLKVGTDIPSLDEIARLVKSLADRPLRWRALLMVAIFSGLRASELRGLRWIDVDFARGELHVRQRADRLKEIGAPKSETSERTVPLPPNVIAILKEWKLACPKGTLGLAFPTTSGGVQDHCNMAERGLQAAMIAAGLAVPNRDAQGQPMYSRRGKQIMQAKYQGWHCLRHWYASWCLARRVDGGLELPIQEVRARLGHSSIALTVDVYSHLLPRSDHRDEMQVAMERLLA